MRWRDLSAVSEPTRILADPDDIPALMGHLETLARDWRNLNLGNAWLKDYEPQVKSLERSSISSLSQAIHRTDSQREIESSAP